MSKNSYLIRTILSLVLSLTMFIIIPLNYIQAEELNPSPSSEPQASINPTPTPSYSPEYTEEEQVLGTATELGDTGNWTSNLIWVGLGIIGLSVLIGGNKILKKIEMNEPEGY